MTNAVPVGDRITVSNYGDILSRLLSVRISMLEITGEGAREIDSGVTQI